MELGSNGRLFYDVAYRGTEMRTGRLRSRLLVVVGVLSMSAGVSAAAEEHVAGEGQTRSVIAGRPEYNKSGYYKFHFGEGYRKLWTTPFAETVLDLGSFAGGLTPVRQVGSMQSLGLALKGADGKSYTFRTFDKDPTKILPPEWRDSFPAHIFQDQTTASHPAGALMVPALAEAAGVPHTNPMAVFMPDVPALGEFRATFGGKAGLIDEYPLPAGAGSAGFHGATDVLSTKKLWEKWLAGEAVVDTRALLRARIFDLFLGDWDRHNGQWRFMRVPGNDGLVALPEDRDQAFSNYSGVVMTLARTTMPKLLAWHDDYDNMNGLLFQGREIDDWLLNGLERSAFKEVALEVQATLTDAVIEAAVRQMPAEWYPLGGAALARDLKKRRDLLPRGAEAFYENLARYVNLQGTNRDDVARLTRQADGSVAIELSLAGEPDASGRTYLKRRFLPNETKEIRIYLYAGNDRLTSTGPRGGIRVRACGGAGADRLDDSQSGGTQFYDVDAPSEVVKGPGTGVSERQWTPVLRKPDTPWINKQDFGSLTPFQPLVWWEPDPGIVLSLGGTQYRYGFRKEPYSSMHHVAVEYKTKRNAFGASYLGDFRWSKPGFGNLVEISADGAKNYNYYGVGNETEAGDEAFTEADQQVFTAFPSLVAYENQRRTLWFALGPELKYARNSASADTLIATTQPYGFGDFGEAGARLRLEADTRGRMLLGMGTAALAPGKKRSDTGLKLKFDGRLYAKAWDVKETFSSGSLAVTGYWQAASRLTLAGRAGGQKVWGTYPWHEAAFIGGSDTIRGYGRNRFAGDASLYGNAQAMVSLFNMNLILPVRVGVLGLAEAGRVWVEGESSDKWHPAFGGGIFLRVPATEFVLHGILAHGTEGNHFHVNVGFGI
jgi:hypothetical protein